MGLLPSRGAGKMALLSKQAWVGGWVGTLSKRNAEGKLKSQDYGGGLRALLGLLHTSVKVAHWPRSHTGCPVPLHENTRRPFLALKAVALSGIQNVPQTWGPSLPWCPLRLRAKGVSPAPGCPSNLEDAGTQFEAGSQGKAGQALSVWEA